MIISSISYKGGVGKSTMSQNLAVSFAKKGNKVCIVDADESNVTVKWSGERNENDIEPFIQVVSMTDTKALMKTVKNLYTDFDVILIDSPPSYKPITAKIMLVSHLILMPIKPTGRSEIYTAQDLLERYDELMEQKEEKVPAYFVINEYDPRSSFPQSFVDAIQSIGEEYEAKICKTKIHRRIAYGEANSQGLGVLEISNKKAIEEIENLTSEVLKIVK